MPNWVSSTLTINGEIAIAAAMAGTQLVITRVSVGSGVAPAPLSTRVGLVTPQMNLTPVPPQVSANNLAPGEVIIMATLDSANVGATFSLVEMGIWAKSGTGAEALIAYCQASAPYDTIATGSGSNRLQINEQIPIVVGVGASVSITVQAGNPIFVPPVVAGPGIAVAAPTNASGQVLEWIVSTPTITNSTTLNVYNGAPNVVPNFSSINNAMAYLSGFSIPSNVYITISVAAGAYSQTSPTSISHVNASQIYISGPKNPDISFTNIGIVGGSQGAWQMQMTGCPNTTNCIVGNWLILWSVGGTASWSEVIAVGFYPITAVTSTTVTVLNPYRGASWPALGGVTGTFTPITAFINPVQGTAGCDGVQISNGIGNFAYIGIVPFTVPPPYTYAHGILASGNCAIDHCGAYAFQNNTHECTGFYTNGTAAISWSFCAALQNNHGFVSSGNCSAALYWCASTHNTDAGYYGDSSGIFVAAPNYLNGTYNSTISWSGGNGGNGIQMYAGAYLVAQGVLATAGDVGGTWYVAYNLGWGCVLAIQAKSNSSFGASIGTTNLNTFTNTLGDVYVGALSTSNISRGGTANLSQAVGVLTAGGVIY